MDAISSVQVTCYPLVYWRLVQEKAVPEPATLALLSLGGMCLLARRRR